MATHKINLQEFLIKLFVVIDDLLICFPKKIGKQAGRTPSLTESEVISLALFGIFAGFKTVSQLYAHVLSYHHQDFPKLPKYKNFNELINRNAQKAAQLLQVLMAFNRNNSTFLIKFVDASAVQVCKNKRIFHHRVCDGVAKRGKSSFGWFYGFKVHICVDEHGKLLALEVTPGNIDDREPVMKLLKDIQGIVITDSGYVSAELQEKLRAKGIVFLSGVRKDYEKTHDQRSTQTFEAPADC